MTVDETGLEYECRACGRKKSTRKQIVQHVNSMSDSKHRGRDVKDLVMPVYPDVMPEDSSGSSYNDIVEAFKRIKSGNVKGLGPEIKNDEINKVTELSGEPKSKCIRILQEERVPYSFNGRHPHTYFDQLSDNQKEIIAYRYHNPDDTHQKIADEIGTDKSSVTYAINNRSWMLEDRFRPDEVDNWFKDDVDVDVDEMVERISHTDEANEQEEPEDEQDVELVEDTYGSHDLYVVVGSDAIYEHLEALILNGNEERAREMFDQILND